MNQTASSHPASMPPSPDAAHVRLRRLLKGVGLRLARGNWLRLISRISHSLITVGPRETVMRMRIAAAAHVRASELSATDVVVRQSIEEMLDTNPTDTTHESAWDRQATFVAAYCALPLGWKQQRVASALGRWEQFKGVVIAPVAYPVDMKQRPEHILKALADRGFLCVMLVQDTLPKGVHEISPGMFITNLFEDVLAYFRDVPVTLYLHFAPLSFVVDVMRSPFVVYDVLDDLSVMSGGDRTERDHRKLLKRADVVLFSSGELLDKAPEVSAKAVLVPNGVWTSDFSITNNITSKDEGVVRIGYHGAISELLNFDLLEKIATLPRVELVLIGRVGAFNESKSAELNERFERLAAMPRVTYLGYQPYGELHKYLATLDAGLIPFIKSDATDGVSPLKLFEFMAARLPVLATSTNTVAQYADVITVAAPSELVEIVANRSWRAVGAESYAEVLHKHDWSTLTEPIVLAIPKASVPARAAAPLKRVDIINVNFFDWDGDVLYRGGAERYVHDLAKLCQSRSIDARILQNANRPFEREYGGVPVVGVETRSKGVNFEHISATLGQHAKDADLLIASPLELASRLDFAAPCIGINHGIHWDGTFNRHYGPPHPGRHLTIDALQRCRSVVCVDTNFINWLRTVDWDLARELCYVPNYVDTLSFKPVEKDFTRTLRVLYPRRLYAPRGLYLTLDAFDRLFSERNDLHLTLCGQATDDDAIAVRAFLSRHEGKVEWITAEMDEMPEVYKRSHVALIPTLNSEGTSLSCIEAFATNNAVIATNVGGLPNLVLDQINGLLIKPTEQELTHAIRRLADDRVLCRNLAESALRHSASYSADVWRSRWSDVLQSVTWQRAVPTTLQTAM